ncbi:hypothetical protein [Thiobacillus sp.]|uniref:hypothetical protein n=1 Tax=Thiobacillus sp. TaxID=924 RepID=UPI0025F93ABA|nr:hypothetical protein [Thiobacillus sp.]MBT9540266.1 hypothetical protein [Thiobacillus sp.]
MTRSIAAFFLLISSIGVLVYVEKEAQAQALQLAKPFTGKVNKAIASTLGKRLNTMGFAANDPIYTATLASAETVVGGAIAAGSVAATVASIGTAPVWLSVALGLGAAYEIYDFSMGQFEVKAVSPASTVQISQGTITHAPALPPPFTGTDYSVVPTDLPYDYADPGVGNAIQYPSDQKICATMTGGFTASGTYCGNTTQEIFDQVYKRHIHSIISTEITNRHALTINIVDGYTSGPTKVVCTISPLICPDGIRYAYSRYQTVNYTFDDYGTPGSGTDPSTLTYYIFNNPKYVDSTKNYSLNDAASKLTESDLNTFADPEILAAIANKIWQQAAQQPGYLGAPYDVQNPVTAADILADVAAGLYPHPTNYDLLSLPSPDAATAPALDPTAQPVQSPATDQVTVDLGPDPGIAEPALEDAPTGASILTHVMGLLPSVSAFTIPVHTADCVMPSFDFFGTTMTMQGACDLIEQQRAMLSLLFTAIWGIAGLVTVLRA